MLRTVPEINIEEKPKRLSPSHIETAKNCQLQFVLNSVLREEQTALPSASSTRYTGAIYHQLLEEARKGMVGVPPKKELLERRWEEIENEVEAQAALNGDSCWLPLRSTDQRFERTRLRAVQFASKMVARNSNTAEGASTTELWMESTSKNVGGRADAVNYVDGEIELVDYKTGSVLTDKNIIDQRYVTQIRLYAALYFESRGQWPDKLVLVDGRGVTHNVPLDNDWSIKALKEAEILFCAILEKFDNTASLPLNNTTMLAQPGEICDYCRHRPVCEAYCEDLDADGFRHFSRHRKVDLIGKLKDVGKSNGFLWTVLEKNGKKRSIRWQETAMSASIESTDLGTTIRVFNVRLANKSDTYEEARLFNAGRDTLAYTGNGTNLDRH